MLKNWFPKAETKALPKGVRLYVFGDLHGRADLLDQAMAALDKDLQESPAERCIEIFLGDYVDRGNDSAGVIERLAAAPKKGRERICLMGNHEDYMMKFINNHKNLNHWHKFGGGETLLSYGIEPTQSLAEESQNIQQTLKQNMPERHVEFLEGLREDFQMEPYYFVHAGVRPGIPFDAQKKQDKITIREDFIYAKPNWPGIIVHGHTPIKRPEVTAKRINIDTGAWISGNLTCLILEQDRYDFLWF